jgi:phosphoribosyl-dephospho-CoA transferase
MRPHDLLRLAPHARLIAEDVPSWVAPALVRARFVVVRRAEISANLIPIGIRGASRAERFPALLHRHDAAETITPESLARLPASLRPLPALAALGEVAKAAARLDIVWGPAGSVGFELGSGAAVVTAQSDLDVVLRPQARHTRAQLAEFLRCVDALDVRVDATIESAQGSVALREWLASPDRVLIKTTAGPQLGTFAW